ncbi:aminoglycoside/choline kinase family phosphotransferase [Constrictibacter sp. MBR-5]|jgi:aminoglycoside/choline kinase family phosphotransferase|uniref:aminoglycoside phosphotransferase family protein n=1 Tax=Constrictibacter sp. MBR-5 TaxID=3156467 RepID=UPI0033974C46
MSRGLLIDRFLDDSGWGGCGRDPLPVDCSFRRYERLTCDDGRHAMLMDAPPPMEDVRPFVKLARHLRRMGVSVPEVMAADEEEGFLVIEDFGDDTYTRLLARGADETALYAVAVDVLAALQVRPAAVDVDVPRYDTDKLLDEAVLFTDWYLPSVTGHAVDPIARIDFVDAWASALAAVTGAPDAPPDTLVLRDFHVDNLMLLRDRTGIASCGLLDFQDAVIGHPAYDLMSLLEDARRDIAPDLQAAMQQRYFAARRDLDRGAFMTAYRVLGAQRHTKVLGIFARKAVRDLMPAYLCHIPRLWRLLEQNLSEPALAPVAAWLAKHVPAEQRRIPEIG